MPTITAYKRPPSIFQNSIIWLARILIMAMLVFELANYLNLLQYPLDFTWLGLIMTSLVTFMIVAAVEYSLINRLGIYLFWGTWPLAFIMLSVDFFGDISRLYGNLGWYDDAAHFLGGMILFGLFYSLFHRLASELKWNFPIWIRFILPLGVYTMLAVSYEFEEYTEDILFHTNRLGNGFDTANDLLMGIAGAVFVILIARVAAEVRVSMRSREVALQAAPVYSRFSVPKNRKTPSKRKKVYKN